MKFLIVALALISATIAQSDQDWANFQRKYGKFYRSFDETLRRRTIWEDNLKSIKAHNENFAKGLTTYTMGENQFADMTYEEFSQNYLGLNGVKPVFNEYHQLSNTRAAPNQYDLRSYSYVSPIKDQGQCGSCWAFATVAAVEGLHATKTKNVLDLSEQQIVDCSKGTVLLLINTNQGCQGGQLKNTFNDMAKSGLQYESDYPYTATNGSCKYNSAKVAVKITGYVGISSEADIVNAVANNNSIAVGIYASQNFMLYKSGIYVPTQVDDSASPNHAVLVVGYDLTSSSNAFYVIKNSWATTWGENGYMRLKHGSDSLGMVKHGMSCYPK